LGWEKTELLHHAQIIAVCEVFDDLPAAHLKHVNVLNLEVTTGWLDPDEHATVHRYPADAPVGAAKHSPYRRPFTLSNPFERSEVNVGESGLDVHENSEGSSATHGSTMVARVLGEEPRGRSHVASVE